ncbi:MAG TPA: amidohydrolase family protein [Pyrinomonadaceae bacterium]|nr:amidohydrolase family protein [Pyrinomonadaceae bacterium]
MRRCVAILLIALALCGVTAGQRRVGGERAPRHLIREVNQVARPNSNRVVAITGATLIDGRGGAAISDSTVIVRGERITAAGPRASVPVPPGADIFDARGLTLLPGLIDAHFHIDGDDTLPALFLSHGITSVRDPGQWIEAYAAVRQKATPLPRLFLTGPHLDSPPPAYPADSIIVRDEEEARLAVSRFVEDGASAIKVYFRLPVGLIKIVTNTAHARGLPVTAHLEIVDANDAIRAGVDGIEHVTSFGTALMPLREAEKYRQSVLADNNARREGRYRVWSTINLDSPRANAMYKLLAERGTFVSPTLAVFERRAGDNDTTDVHVRAFRNMLAFVGRARRAGARVVVGSHSGVPHAERGWAYQRELELLVTAGLTPMESIVAATLENARFFRVDDRLGSVERGKLADLVLVEGDPLKDIGAMRHVRRVMLNGRWVELGAAEKKETK